MMDYLGDVATGIPEKQLRIAGRPRVGSKECYAICEEAGPPIQMHYRDGLGHFPHLKRDCPDCEAGNTSLVPHWYVGACIRCGMRESDGIYAPTFEPVIVELTTACFTVAAAAARRIKPVGPQPLDEILLTEAPPPKFTGLLIVVGRPNYARSPRWARCEQRVPIHGWPYETRRELARIWNIPLKPRIYKEA